MLLIALCVVAVQGLGGYLIYCAFSTWEVRGTFGDMFGAVNALFSGLAFAGVIYAIFLQRKELALQREELVATREELRRSAEAQEKSEIALGEQAEMLRQSAQAQQRSGVYSAISILISSYEDRIAALQREIDRLRPRQGDHMPTQQFEERQRAIQDRENQVQEIAEKRRELVDRLTDLYEEDEGVADE